MSYQVILSQTSYDNISTYLLELQQGLEAGSLLQDQLKEKELLKLSLPEFMTCLLRSKQPHIFAETDVCGDGSDWTQRELSLLGDISIAMPVLVYDNARHKQRDLHVLPFKAHLSQLMGLC